MLAKLSILKFVIGIHLPIDGNDDEAKTKSHSQVQGSRWDRLTCTHLHRHPHTFNRHTRTHYMHRPTHTQTTRTQCNFHTMMKYFET